MTATVTNMTFESTLNNEFITEMTITSFGLELLEMEAGQDVTEWFPAIALINCQYCGQWMARRCACKYCGGPSE